MCCNHSQVDVNIMNNMDEAVTLFIFRTVKKSEHSDPIHVGRLEVTPALYI